MKILALSKRQYMGRDLLDDRFGRFRELPLELARLGHEVCGLSLSYRSRSEACVIDRSDAGDCSVKWRSVNLMRSGLPTFRRYFRYARDLISEFEPDIIWAGSDACQVIFGYRLARETKCPLVADLYDNFEAFGGTKIPGVLRMFRAAVKNSDGVTLFSQRLADYVSATYPVTNPFAVILSGVRKDLFYPRDKITARQKFNLPLDATIIGTAGAIDSSRDIETVFSAFETLAAKNPEIYLALAGARKVTQKIPVGERVHDFGILPHDQVPEFLSALDLAIISYRHSAQGEYSFPQKAYEIIASGVPLVAAVVGSMNELLREYPNCLYEPGDVQNLCKTIERQLVNPVTVGIPAPSWSDSALRLANFFAKVLNTAGSVHNRSSIPAI